VPPKRQGSSRKGRLRELLRGPGKPVLMNGGPLLDDRQPDGGSCHAPNDRSRESKRHLASGGRHYLKMSSGLLVIVEDNESLRSVMQLQLSKLGYQIASAADAEEALNVLKHSHPALVITDLQLPGMSGFDFLKKVRIEFPATPVIVVTAFGTIESAVRAMKAGAYDYITKPLQLPEMQALVECALNQPQRGGHAQQSPNPGEHDHEFDRVICGSSCLRPVLDVAARVAPTDATVLILGETGTGKELVARGIHRRSTRREHAFVTVSCGSIPKELLESELFGYTKGSFTGAVTNKKGKVEIADRGTLFLDEIREMPLALQVRILRLLQEREIEKIGSTAPSKVDVRIIAATHRNLEAMVKQGTFREDLYYRLLVIPITLPPLRERLSDIPGLVRHFAIKYAERYARADIVFVPEVLSYFTNYRWPGNVRQLENTIERIVLLTPESEIRVDHLPEFLKQRSPEEEIIPADLPEAGLDVEAVELRLIVRALQKFGGNQTRAAQFLNMSRRAFAYRVKKHGLGKLAPEASEQAAG
jgi:DNA-binding NtrC family response regulator